MWTLSSRSFEALILLWRPGSGDLVLVILFLVLHDRSLSLKHTASRAARSDHGVVT